MCLVITQPGKVQEMNLSGRDPYIVVPLPSPPVWASLHDGKLPPIAEAYPQAILRRHTIHRGGPGPYPTPHPLDEEFVAYWPDSWRDEWALAEFERWRAAA